MKRSGRIVLFAVPLLLLFGLLALPSAASEGVRRGLGVCAGAVVPALFPFLVLSALLRGSGLPELLSARLRRLTARAFAAPGCAALPFLLGLTGGYPVGAAALAGLVRDGALDAEDAERLLPVCNNTGPGFLLGAVGLGAFASLRAGLILWSAHALAAVALGLLSAVGRPRGESGPDGSAAARPPTRSLASLLPEAVREAVGAALQLCGFVLFFSVLTALLDAAGLLRAAALFLHVRTGLELRAARALLVGLLELGGGAAALHGLAPTPLNLALAAFLLGFGSLSVCFQTFAVLEGTKIKASRQFTGRLMHAAISAALTFGLANFVM